MSDSQKDSRKESIEEFKLAMDGNPEFAGRNKNVVLLGMAAAYVDATIGDSKQASDADVIEDFALTIENVKLGNDFAAEEIIERYPNIFASMIAAGKPAS